MSVCVCVCVCVYADGVSVNTTRQVSVGGMQSEAVNPRWSSKPEPDTGRHDNNSDAASTAVCDWRLNVTWILRQYNDVSQLTLF